MSTFKRGERNPHDPEDRTHLYHSHRDGVDFFTTGKLWNGNGFGSTSSWKAYSGSDLIGLWEDGWAQVNGRRSLGSHRSWKDQCVAFVAKGATA
jgi:hypothetical protein